MRDGPGCRDYEFRTLVRHLRTRPCNLEAQTSGFLGKQSAGEEDDAEQNVNAVIGLAEM
jgi:hypothetical protein